VRQDRRHAPTRAPARPRRRRPGRPAGRQGGAAPGGMVGDARGQGGPVPWRRRAHPELHRGRGRRRTPAHPAGLAGRRHGEGQPGLGPVAGAAARAGGRQDRLHGRATAGRARAVLRSRPGAPERVAAQGGLDQRREPVRPPGGAGRPDPRRPGRDGLRGSRGGRRPAGQGRRVRRSGVRAGHSGGPDRTAHRLRHHRARTPGRPGRHDPADQPRRSAGLHRHARARDRLPPGRAAPGRRDLLGRPDRGEDRGHPPAGRAAQPVSVTGGRRASRPSRRGTRTHGW